MTRSELEIVSEMTDEMNPISAFRDSFGNFFSGVGIFS
jgi:hypothetical protein